MDRQVGSADQRHVLADLASEHRYGLRSRRLERRRSAPLGRDARQAGRRRSRALAVCRAPFAATRQNIGMAGGVCQPGRPAVHHRTRVGQSRRRAVRRGHHRVRPGPAGRHRVRRAAQSGRPGRGGQAVRRHRIGQDRVRPVRARRPAKSSKSTARWSISRRASTTIRTKLAG